MFFLFGPEWPEAAKEADAKWHRQVTFYFKFFYFPALLILFFVTPFYKTKDENTALILFITFVMIFLFTFQMNYLMEGRYRKAFAPLIVTSLYLMFYNFKSEGKNVIAYVVKYYWTNGMELLKTIFGRTPIRLRPI